MSAILYVDIRCLQDPNYQYRGVGFHVSALLRSRQNSDCARHRVIGLVDSSLPVLPGDYAALVDGVVCAPNVSLPLADTFAYLDPSPMTHPAQFALRFTHSPRVLKAAVVHDFIPLDWPGYFPTLASRIDYMAKVTRLRAFDVQFPVSAYSAWRAEALTGTPRSRMVVTGSSVRAALYTLYGKIRPSLKYPSEAEPYFMTVGGGDRRKNTETVVAAVRRMNDQGRRIRLKAVGNYDDAYRRELLLCAGHAEEEGFLEFCVGVDDETLVRIYAGAIASVAPSHIEGFSLPVVESAICATPVIASCCGAQLELVQHPAALFPSHDVEALTARLLDVLDQPQLRDDIAGSQAHLPALFHESQVGARLWGRLGAEMSSRPSTFSIGGGHLPRLAFLSPFPPQRSGVARYTERTLAAATSRFEIDLYTNAPRPLTVPAHVRDAGLINRSVLLKGRYDHILSVVGNSDLHIPIFDFHEEFGGPCILHDSRLTQIYHWRFGRNGFIRHAEQLLGRSVSNAEIDRWLEDRDPPSLFVEPVISRATPLIVHTDAYREILKERYGLSAFTAPFCPNSVPDDEELTRFARKEARRRLGVDSRRFLIATFGNISRTKSFESCIIAIEFLRFWKIPAELFFVGDPMDEAQKIEQLARKFGVLPYIHWKQCFVDASTYNDFLLASDAAVQLRTYGFGQPSAALSDCISTGIRCVASHELARSCDAPSYVLTVPDAHSPLQIAEQLAVIAENAQDRSVYEHERHHYLRQHSFDAYASRLKEILEG